MMSDSKQQQQQQSDPCDDPAPRRFAGRAIYDNRGNLYPPVIAEAVSDARLTSTVQIFASGTVVYGGADALRIVPIDGAPDATKSYDSASATILVTFPHPRDDCAEYEWDLEFRARPPLLPLKVKIRKTRVDKDR